MKIRKELSPYLFGWYFKNEKKDRILPGCCLIRTGNDFVFHVNRFLFLCLGIKKTIIRIESCIVAQCN